MIYGRSFLINNHPALVYLHNQLSGVRLYDFSSNLHFPFGDFFFCMAIFFNVVSSKLLKYAKFAKNVSLFLRLLEFYYPMVGSTPFALFAVV